MTCARYELDLLDAARGGDLPAPAAEHLASCRRCAARLEEQRDLTALLGAAARAPEPVAPPLPESLRRHLLRAPQPPAARRSPAWLALPAAAVAAFVLLRAPESPRPAAAVLPTETTTTAPAVRSTPAPSPLPAPATARPTPSRRREPRTTSAPERATRFVRVPYSEAWGDTDGLQLVRVQMPRSALVRYGWPAMSDVRPVTADVLVGADGMARAIRLVEPGGFRGGTSRGGSR